MKSMRLSRYLNDYMKIYIPVTEERAPYLFISITVYKLHLNNYNVN